MNKRLSYLSLSLLALLAHPSGLMANPLQLSVTHGSTASDVSVTLTNVGDQPLSILTWDTPFEDTLSHNVFQVTSSEKALPFTNLAPYIGRHVKRRAPEGDSYFVLAAGESKTADVNLSQYYKIDDPGVHAVRFNGHINYTPATANKITAKNSIEVVESLQTQEFFSKSVQLHLNPQATGTRLEKQADFNACSAEQQVYIQSATDAAEMLAGDALSDLQSLTEQERQSSPRYTTWFGSYTEQRFNQVVDNFSAISDALTNETLRFDCTCDDSYFAYVYPTQPYNIFLCQAFHQAAELGTDSRAGTIIHELSHFNILAGTEDHVYSQQGTQNLASTDPDRAIDNADNHEYFAENTPFIDIRSDGSTPPSTNFEVIEPGTVYSGSVLLGETVLFESSAIDLATLTSVTGDADLRIYSDAQLSNRICYSDQRPPATDSCEISQSSTVYIEVYGSSDADFELEVTAQAVTPPAEFTDLVLDSTVSGSLAIGEIALYTTADAGLISLVSNSGDADLYVYSSNNLESSSLLCSSATTGATDTCELPIGTTVYIEIVGYESSNYQITASEGSSSNEQTIIDFGSIEPNTLLNQSVAREEIHLYQVSLASTDTAVVELVSLSGDADLLVFDSPPLDGAAAICTSDEYSVDSTLDSCEISGISELYISVYGFTDSQYTLEAIQSVSSGGGSSGSSGGGGGGNLGPAGLLIGLMLLAVSRVRRRH